MTGEPVAGDLWRAFHGPNAGYVLELYERYRADPHSIDAATRAAFERWSPEAATTLAPRWR
jgi:2-oxoglutarate dehydrogenase E1 component